MRCAGLALVAACIAWPAAQAAPAGDEAFAFPAYRSVAQVNRACSGLLADLSRLQQGLVRMKPDGGIASLAAMDVITMRSEDTIAPLELIAEVHPSKPLRDAAHACSRRVQSFSTRLFQDGAIHALLVQARPADDIDERMRRELLDAFEDAGAGLAPAAQARSRAISDEITKLTQVFDQRVQEDRTRVAFTPAELEGVPAEVWRRAPRDAQRRVLLGLDYPSSGPVIEQAREPAARERMWRAVMRRGGEANLKTLGRIAALRREDAKLFGFESYADFVLRRRMAQSDGRVQAFLSDVTRAVEPRERADIEMLRQAKASDLGLDPGHTTLAHWDRNYYLERARKAAYSVQQQDFRRHFPPEASLAFVFRIAETLFGIRIEAAPQSLWHADARRYVVRDAAENRLLGTLFVDLYPRADKYGHAAVFPVRNVSTLAQRLPAAALVVNFDRQGLSLDELETLLHEFGHAMHALLSTTRYASQGGTNVKLDFVEAPSQMLEDWVYDTQVLRLFREVCPSCEPVPDEKIAQARAARGFGKGTLYGAQLLYARYDMALHGARPEDPMALWARLEGATPLGYVPGTMLPASFQHLVDGYGAGYYGYLWSEVVAYDLRTAFDGHRLDPEVGRRYRSTVLAHGGEIAPDTLLNDFLGRPSDSRAFYEWLNAP